MKTRKEKKDRKKEKEIDTNREKEKNRSIMKIVGKRARFRKRHQKNRTESLILNSLICPKKSHFKDQVFFPITILASIRRKKRSSPASFFAAYPTKKVEKKTF
jgi:hypothetical protein